MRAILLEVNWFGSALMRLLVVMMPMFLNLRDIGILNGEVHQELR
jgi:hypothetical protein